MLWECSHSFDTIVFKITSAAGGAESMVSLGKYYAMGCSGPRWKVYYLKFSAHLHLNKNRYDLFPLQGQGKVETSPLAACGVHAARIFSLLTYPRPYSTTAGLPSTIAESNQAYRPTEDNDGDV